MVLTKRSAWAVAAHQGSGLHGAPAAADLGAMPTGVMLHLLAWTKVVLAGRFGGRVTDPLPPAEGGQGRIRERRPGGGEFFMDAHQVALATRVELQNLVAVGRGLLGAHQGGHAGRAGAQDAAHGAAGSLQGARDLPDTMPLLVQLENRSSGVLIQHDPSPGRSRAP